MAKIEFIIGDYRYEVIRDGEVSVKVIDKSKDRYDPIPCTVEHEGVVYSVTDMESCFWGCSSLVEAPVIPDSVTNMSICFFGCSSLVKAPVIPNSVTNMSICFFGCSSLVKAPVIPGSVTDMTYCFYDCALLKVTLTDILIEKAGVGSIIEFGSYPQGKQGKIAPIKWLMLAKEQGHILIISKYALDYKPYDTKFKSVTWENCSLRHWLNGEFLKRAFSPKEQNRILESAVTADINPDYSTPPGNDTADKVFLLSILEAKKYFGSDGVRRCKGTEYCYAQGADEDLDNGNCKWWLRSPGDSDFMAAIVYGDGYVAKFGKMVDIMYAVRPALWISLEP